MRQPEMSYSPAYYQDNGHLVTAYPPDATLVTLPAAHIPPKQQLFRHHQDLFYYGTPSEPSSLRDPSRRISDSSATPYHSHQVDLEQPAVSPVTFVPSPRFEDGSILTLASNSSGTARKEERIRGSWTDRSSYMSGDNHPPGVSRVHKRALHDEDPSSEGNHDALSMIFRLSVPVPIFSFAASLYALFGLLFVIILSPLRLCSFTPFLRSTTFKTQLCELLAPALHVHERLVCAHKSLHCRSSSTQWVYNDAERLSALELTECYSPGGLILVLALSSLLSIALFLVTWTAALFWVFAMMMGNPDGTERKDDGRAAVLGVAKWWQMWLSKARRLSG